MIDMFVNDKLDAAAGVRQPLEDYAKSHPEMRVMSGAFQQIQQAMGMPKKGGEAGKAGAAYLAKFVEEMKASGFVADALKRSGQVAQVRAAGEVKLANWSRSSLAPNQRSSWPGLTRPSMMKCNRSVVRFGSLIRVMDPPGQARG